MAKLVKFVFTLLIVAINFIPIYSTAQVNFANKRDRETERVERQHKRKIEHNNRIKGKKKQRLSRQNNRVQRKHNRMANKQQRGQHVYSIEQNIKQRSYDKGDTLLFYNKPKEQERRKAVLDTAKLYIAELEEIAKTLKNYDKRVSGAGRDVVTGKKVYKRLRKTNGRYLRESRKKLIEYIKQFRRFDFSLFETDIKPSVQINNHKNVYNKQPKKSSRLVDSWENIDRLRSNSNRIGGFYGVGIAPSDKAGRRVKESGVLQQKRSKKVVKNQSQKVNVSGKGFLPGAPNSHKKMNKSGIVSPNGNVNVSNNSHQKVNVSGKGYVPYQKTPRKKNYKRAKKSRIETN